MRLRFLILSFVALFGGTSAPAAGPLCALLVGGGPDRERNTAQIEEHLRFVTSLVPPSGGRVVLFADGKTSNRSLSFTDTQALSPGERALDILLPDDDFGAKVQTRKPDIGAPLDGPARLASIHRGMQRLAALNGASPVLLYFAGHGSTVSRKKRDRSLYNLWSGENLDPGTLAREIEQLPQQEPVTVVMAQCFSGGFGSILFKNGDAGQAPVDRPITAFFAAEGNREAAGCGTETNSPYYQDFSSYFFGALSGRDRLGRAVSGADYDSDGVVSCYEAFCHALIHDDSIDTPLCSSMIFLRRFANVDDATLYNSTYSSIFGDATPAQRAVLEALSTRLALSGEHRLLDAFDRLMFGHPVAQARQMQAYREAQDRLNSLRMEDLRALFVKWPDLRWQDSHNYNSTAKNVAAQLNKDKPRCEELVDAQDRFDKADDELDVEEALLVRYTDLCEAVIRGEYLRRHAPADLRARFDKLWQGEQLPLPLVSSAPR